MKRSFLYLGHAVIVLIVLSSSAVAQSQSDETNSETSKGIISGRVVDQNGQRLASALVSVRSYGNSQRGATATTDNEGNFQVGGLEPFAYIVSAALPGYVAMPRDPDANPVGFYRVGDSVRLEVTKGGVITGTVKKANGDPVVSVLVRAFMIRDNKGQPARYGAPVRTRPTDDRGVYRIYGLAPGTYVVSAGGAGNVNGYSVDAYGGDVPTYAPSSPRDTATEGSVNASEETANVDIRYREEAGHTVSGTASSALAMDQPNGFKITISSIFKGTLQACYSFFLAPGARGFSFSGVADGDYDVTAQQYSPATGWFVSEPRRIKVQGADISGLDLMAKQLASINGSLVLEDSKLPECQGKRQPLPGETVVGPWHNEKTARKDQPQFVWGLGGPTLPDKDGNFALQSLAPGQYRFNVRPMAKYWYLKSISWPASAASAKAMAPDRPRDAARNWTNVRMGERLSGLTITFAAGAASLRGQIEVGEGKKLPARVFVYLVPAEPENAEDILRYFFSLAAEDGTF